MFNENPFAVNPDELLGLILDITTATQREEYYRRLGLFEVVARGVQMGKSFAVIRSTASCLETAVGKAQAEY